MTHKKILINYYYQHGWMLVSHALAYVTASKNGVSEPEIEDFISLDDKVETERERGEVRQQEGEKERQRERQR